MLLLSASGIRDVLLNYLLKMKIDIIQRESKRQRTFNATGKKFDFYMKECLR